MGLSERQGDSIRSLFNRAISLPADQRAAVLTDPSLDFELREELRALLEADTDSDSFFTQILSTTASFASGIGEEFGAYRTSEVLGRGGMGVVFKACRIDGELNQTVAIKAVQYPWLDPRASDRFRHERQILSGLVHNNIARLLDGGTRSDGLAYLVMEYVEGQRIDEFCDQKQLDIDDRVRLFLPVCDAVDYAHRKLIVHRDLKPSNVMVNAAGEPKLLDFGIAKTLDTAHSASTSTVAITPDYASPEQASNGEITTATDIYGLGAVLYFLLTGQAPHHLAGRSAAQIQQSLREGLPQKPSALRPELRGDLENILLKALHTEPSRRYLSAREVSDDLQRYLSHHPVQATPDGAAYRAGRFVRRHLVATIAGAAAALAIIAGAATSLYQAHRAQQRFAQVRDLSNRFIFDFEAAIRDLPGTLSARRMMASTARQYLADLAAEAGNDAGLNRELAESYYALGRAEQSAGENDEAIEHLKQSRQIYKSLHDDCCGPANGRLRYITTVAFLARYMIDSRTPEDSVTYGSEALKAAQSWYQQSPNDSMANRAMATAESNQGIVLLNREERREGVKLLQDADQRFETLVKQNPSDDDLSYQMARAELSLANRLADPEPSPTRLRLKARVDAYLARHPESVRWRNLAIYISSSNASLLRERAISNPALNRMASEAYRETYDLAKVKAQQSPGDLAAIDDVAVMANKVANELMRQNRFAEAEPFYIEDVQTVDRLLRVDPNDRRNLYLKANGMCGLGSLYGELGRNAEEGKTLDEAESISRMILAKWPGDLLTPDVLISILLHKTKMQRRMGQLANARRSCREALAMAADLTSREKQRKHPVSFMDDLLAEARRLNLTMTGTTTSKDANTPR